MCSILVTNRKKNLEKANYFTQFRGPDLTNSIEKNGVTFLHNLLSITGAFTPQPFVDEQDEIVTLFNGQIYNYKDFGEYPSDGHTLIPLYKKHGPEFITKLNGEFAIVLADFKKGVMIVSTDVFATKPLWVAHDGESFAFATYESALKTLGFSNREKLVANTTRVYSLPKLTYTETPVFVFDAGNQHKQTCEDFIKAFENSIKLRSSNLRERIFIGLSGGYDSGAIACELTKQGLAFKAYSILGEEDPDLLKARHALLKEPGEIFDLSYAEYSRAKFYIKQYVEPFQYPINPSYKKKELSDDSGAIGLSAVCARAKRDGIKIYFSGQGADEIFSDYGQDGKKLSSHSTFGGVFPDDLAAHFPWKNFYEGAQIAYLAKEEYVSGSYGLEGRYPFLDKNLVQEFLWLHPSLKNRSYKYPLKEYLERNKYPFNEGKKTGFILGTYPVISKFSPPALYERFKYYVQSGFGGI